MKYENTRTPYSLKGYKGVVCSFNAEKEKYLHYGKWINDVSWSHGLTHLKDWETGEYRGFCGTEYFEENAEEVVE